MFRSREEQPDLFPTDQGHQLLDHLGKAGRIRRLCGRKVTQGGLGHDCAARRHGLQVTPVASD